MSFDKFIYSCNLHHSQATEDCVTPVTWHNRSVFGSHCFACSSVSLNGIILYVLFCVGLVLLSISVEVIHTFARISSLFFYIALCYSNSFTCWWTFELFLFWAIMNILEQIFWWINWFISYRISGSQSKCMFKFTSYVVFLKIKLLGIPWWSSN